ncbi:MAG: hypothetical protein JXA49_03445 [Actinobacteria bacterium]|nr:hypothetical protein [Actinomycetota bacterium]
MDKDKCWEIKRCSASQYLNCKAYQERKRCWEISNPRSSRSMMLCVQLGCPFYDLHMREIDEEIKYRLKLMYPFLSSLEESDEH